MEKSQRLFLISSYSYAKEVACKHSESSRKVLCVGTAWDGDHNHSAERDIRLPINQKNVSISLQVNFALPG